MSLIPITVYGDEILTKKVKPVRAISDQEIKQIKDMFETMHFAKGIGLAANQVGLQKAIFVVDVSQVEGYEKIKPIVFINPKIVLHSEELVFMEEGCLSLPDIRLEVERPEIIKIKYLDTDENEQELEADDLLARVILHEYDHLLGKMITDRADRNQIKEIKKDLVRIKLRDIEVDYPITERQK